MSFRLSSFRIFPSLAVAGAACLLACSAQGADQRRGRSIEFSEPRSAEVITNLNQLTSKKDGLKQLEEDLYRPLQTFAPKSSLDGFFDPPERPRSAITVPSKRAKELLERQRNWIFLDPDDLAAGPTAEQIFNIPEYDANGQEKKKLSVMERYFENEDRKRAGKTKASKSRTDDLFGLQKEPGSLDEAGSKDDVKRSDEFSEREKALRKLFGSEPGSSPAPVVRGTLSDIFGLGEKTQSAEDLAKHNASIR